MTGGRRFDPTELDTDRSDELEDARTAAAWLGAAVDVPPVAPSPAFTDRVMAALADEPAPSPVGFMVPLRQRGFLAGFAASVGQAWSSLGGGGRPFLARASALAYVLAIVVAGTSLAGVATIGALGMLGPTSTQSAAPSPGPVTSPDQSPSPSPSVQSAPPTPSETVEPSEPPESSDDHGGGGAEPSDDHLGNSPGSSGDDEHGSESDDSETETPDSSHTPRPTKTPDPTESD